MHGSAARPINVVLNVVGHASKGVAEVGTALVRYNI